MKDTETKLAFIKARAEGKSYSTITKELGIAKATCTSWEQSLKGDIEAMKRAQTEELYTAYNMKREARIKAHKGTRGDSTGARQSHSRQAPRRATARQATRAKAKVCQRAKGRVPRASRARDRQHTRRVTRAI